MLNEHKSRYVSGFSWSMSMSIIPNSVWFVSLDFVRFIARIAISPFPTPFGMWYESLCLLLVLYLVNGESHDVSISYSVWFMARVTMSPFRTPFGLWQDSPSLLSLLGLFYGGVSWVALLNTII